MIYRLQGTKAAVPGNTTKTATFRAGYECTLTIMIIVVTVVTSIITAIINPDNTTGNS